jgi:acyl-CoA synthetase (AMP-forming)/AMP-acid ligase II
VLASVIRQAAQRFGDAPALVPEDGPPISYAELNLRSDRAAGGLAKAGLGPGGVVALVMPSGPEYVIAYAAASKLGAATVGINPRLTAAERRAAIDAAGPDMAIMGEGFGEGLPDDLSTTEGVPESETGDGAERRPAEPEEVQAIVLTSGTTGAPRGAVFQNRQLAAISRMDAGIAWGGGPPMLVATEMAHIGFMTKLPWYLRMGGPIHLMQRWRPGDALGLIARERIPVVGGIAAQIALMLREPSFGDHDLSAVSLVVAGGGPSSPALVREARERFGAGYSIRYSSTESGGLGTMTDSQRDDEAEIASVGRPREGVHVQIRDEDGVKLPIGEHGEIWLHSPAVMSGYRGAGEASARALVDGWLRTGDAGHLDEEDRLHVSGRTVERYRRGGYFVYPQEVEAVLSRHPGVKDVAIVPRDDEVYGQLGVAVVVAANGSSAPTLESLRAFGAGSLASYKLPDALRVSDGLPLTTMHKIDRRALAQVETSAVSLERSH